MGIRDSILDLINQNIVSLGRDELSFIDVGSFNGEFAASFAKNYPSSTMYAIEACPTNFKSVQDISSNVKNIIPCWNAISDSDGEVIFNIAVNNKYKGKLSSQSNSLYSSFVDGKKWASKFEKVSVPSFTLDSFCSCNSIQHIDFLKINCEGCEYKIFESKTLDFLNMTDIIYLEMHTKCSRFLTEEFNEKRREIEDILNKSFKKIYQSNSNMHKKHIEQVWRKI